MLKMNILLSLGAVALITLLALFFITQPTAIDPTLESTIQSATQAYESANYAQAAQAYEQVVQAGGDDSDLYYNLGNAYFKQGDIGRAILNYQRAIHLNPRDEDSLANLALAQAQTKDQLETSNESLAEQVATVSQQWLSQNEMALLILGLWFLLAMVIVGFRFSPSARTREWLLYSMCGVGFLVIVGGLMLMSQLYVSWYEPAAIIVAEQVDVSSGPGSQNVTEFTLHAGTEVKLLEERESWARIALPGGELQGWIPREAAVEVIPSTP